MNVKAGQIVTVIDPADSSAELMTVEELNGIGFTANGIQFKSDGVEYMQGVGHWTARYVEVIE